MKELNLETYESSIEKLSPLGSQQIETPQDSRKNLVVLLLITINLAITVPLAAVLNIWFDESYSLNTSGQGLGYAISQAIHFEEQAPLYFALLTLWRSLNDSFFFARLFSVLCIALTIYVAALLSKRFFRDLHPGWIAAAIAIHPIAIWAAVEIRLYAFSILLSSLIVLFFFEGYLKQKPNKFARLAYIVLATSALYTHYFLGFILFANAIVLLGRGKRFRHYCLDMVISGILFLPMVWIVIQQVFYLSNNYAVYVNDTAVPFIDSFKISFGGIPKYLLPDIRSPLAGSLTSIWKLLRVCLISVLFFILFKERRNITKNNIIIWLITVVTAAIFFIAFELVDAIYFRHSSLMLVPSLLSMFGVFYLIKGSARKRVLSIWLTATLLLNGSALAITYSPLAKSGDYGRVAAYIEANEEPNQAILVFDPQVAMSLEHHYKGVNSLLALPEKEDFKVYDYSEFTLDSEQQITTALAQLPDEHSDLWLVTYTDFQGGLLPVYERSYQILEKFVDTYYTIETDRDFYGSNVRLLHQSRRT